MKSNPQFSVDQFMEECKNGKYSGRDVVKQEPGVAAKKVDMTKKYNFDENSAQNQEAFKKRILNPEKTDNDPKKTRWVADGFTNSVKENLPILGTKPKNFKKKLNTLGSITAIISKPPPIKDDSNIDRLIQTIMASKRTPNQLAAFLGINVKLIRLISH